MPRNDSWGARVRNCVRYYTWKYPQENSPCTGGFSDVCGSVPEWPRTTVSNWAAIKAAKAEFIRLQDNANLEEGKDLNHFSANGQDAGWAIGLNVDQRVDCLGTAIEILEGRRSKTIVGRAGNY